MFSGNQGITCSSNYFNKTTTALKYLFSCADTAPHFCPTNGKKISGKLLEVLGTG